MWHLCALCNDGALEVLLKSLTVDGLPGGGGVGALSSKKTLPGAGRTGAVGVEGLDGGREGGEDVVRPSAPPGTEGVVRRG